MTDTDMLYMASLEKKNNDLEAKVAELEDKHWNECGQIAHYDDELKALLSKVDIGAAKPKDYLDLLNEWAKMKKLLKAAVEDIRYCMHYYDPCEVCALLEENGECAAADDDDCNEKYKWRCEAEALALIGEDGERNDT